MDRQTDGQIDQKNKKMQPQQATSSRLSQAWQRIVLGRPFKIKLVRHIKQKTGEDTSEKMN